MKKNITVEVCAANILSCRHAKQAGAQRVELCCALAEGGLTPYYSLIKQACAISNLKVHVLIRPREGDFCYTPEETDLMCQDIEMCKELGANGVVIGALKPNGELDTKTMERLISVAKPLTITFHRAFDCCKDPFMVMEQLIALKVDIILTSGQCATAPEGAEALTILTRRAAGRIQIMAGSGISPQNVGALVQQTGVDAVHLSGRKLKTSPSTYYPNGPSLPSFGGLTLLPERDYYCTDPQAVAAVVAQFK